MAKKKIVIGVISSDCHTVGNKIIHNKLEESGYYEIGRASCRERV